MLPADNSLIREAIEFAAEAHKGQTRKYTGEPYVNHCFSVAETVWLIERMPNMTAAALLHDVVEDCDGYTIDTIKQHFGWTVAQYVDDLTKRDYLHPDWPRARRKAYEAGRLSQVSPISKTIKLADLIDNTRTIVPYDPEFAKTYLAEKRILIEDSLVGGHPLLVKIASEQVELGELMLKKLEESNADRESTVVRAFPIAG